MAGTLLDPAHLARADESKLRLPEEIGTEKESRGASRNGNPNL